MTDDLNPVIQELLTKRAALIAEREAAQQRQDAASARITAGLVASKLEMTDAVTQDQQAMTAAIARVAELDEEIAAVDELIPNARDSRIARLKDDVAKELERHKHALDAMHSEMDVLTRVAPWAPVVPQ